MPKPTPAGAGPHVRGRHGVAELAQAHMQDHGQKGSCDGSAVAPIGATMTRDQYEMWSRMLAGSTIRELRHMRDVPRAYIALPVVQSIEREHTQALRRAS